MKFHVTCALGLLAYSVSALPAPQKQKQKLPLRPGESCTPINNQPGVFGCQDGTGGTFNIVNGKRQKRAADDDVIEARTPKILTDSKGNKFDDSIFIVDGQLLACPSGQQC